MSAVSERITLFLYLADSERNVSDLCDTMRRKVLAVRHVRGKRLQELTRSFESYERIYKKIMAERDGAGGESNVKELVDEARTELEKYKREGAVFIPWLKDADRELYDAASTVNHNSHFLCGCQQAKQNVENEKADEAWFASFKTTSNTDDDNDTTTSSTAGWTSKRTKRAKRTFDL